MRATGVLYGQVLTVFGIVTAGVWSATQWVAASLSYQSRLGAPWFEVFDTRSTTPGGCLTGGSSSMPMRPGCLSPEVPSPGPVAWWQRWWSSACRSGARDNHAW